MVKDIVGKVLYENRTLGTCFLINDKYVFTARHVLEEESTKELVRVVKCEFEYGNQESSAMLIYEDEENDFGILELDDKITSNFYKISRDVIEESDQWNSSGYIVSDIKLIKFNGWITEKISNNRYEAYIYNQEDNGEWSGVSGAPIIIENEIAGIVVEEESGGNLKARLEIVSIESIIDKLKIKETGILESIEIGYHPLLKDRLDSLSAACKEIFHVYTEVKDNNNTVKYHVFVEDDNSIERLATVLDCFIRDYGIELLLDEQYGKAIRMEKREIEIKINRKRNHIINLIKKQSQLIHILLWMLIEGELGCLRIGSYIVDMQNNIPRDIYIKNNAQNINIIIGNGYLDESIINLFKDCIHEIDEHLEKNKIKKYIIVKDSLVIRSLNYLVQDKINTNMFQELDQSRINLSVALLVGFNYEPIFRDDLSNDDKIDYLRNYVDEYAEQFEKAVRESKWINNIELNYFFIPFKDINTFDYNFKNKYL